MTADLRCGDAIEVLRALQACSVDACVTDPTYGETSCAWDKLVPGWPDEVRRVLKPAGSLWVFGSLRSMLATRDEFTGWSLAQDVVWEKHNGSNNAADRFRRVHELVAHFYPADVPWSEIYKEPQFTNDAQRRAVRRKKGPAHWGEIGPSFYESEDGGPRHMRSVMYQRSMHGKGVKHETPKPPELIEPLIRYSCVAGGVVLDPFMGSGQTGVAALRCGRTFIGIDIRPECVTEARRQIDNDAPLLNRPPGAA